MIRFRIYWVGLVLLFATLLPSQSWASSSACLTKDISLYQWRVRHIQALPAELSLAPDQTIEQCIRLTGVGKFPLTLKPKDYKISINGASFVESGTLTINDNDTLLIQARSPSKKGMHQTIRLLFKETNPDARRNTFIVPWQIQTRNDSLVPTQWLVGSDKRYKQVADVLPKVKGGDTIILNANETFEPFEIKNISGSRNKPITLTSNTKNASERPIITGAFDKYGWTVAVRASHFWSFSNIKIADGKVCFRNEAHGTKLENVLIRDCHIGVMGTDRNSGSLTITHSEIFNSGGKPPGQKWGHAIYVASDQHAFPGSTFTLVNSYLHDNKGNNVKSRFERSLIKRNWIEGGEDSQARYLIELIGFDGAYDFNGQSHQVVENYLIHKSTSLGSRVGGDGNSPSRGTMSFSDNVFIIESGFTHSIVRTFQGLEAVSLTGNSVVYSSELTNNILLDDEVEDDGWVGGTPTIEISNNVLNENITLVRTPLGVFHKSRGDVSINSNLIFDPLVLKHGFIEQNRPLSGKYIGAINLH